MTGKAFMAGQTRDQSQVMVWAVSLDGEWAVGRANGRAGNLAPCVASPERRHPVRAASRRPWPKPRDHLTR
jgi:hypothetical protein